MDKAKGPDRRGEALPDSSVWQCAQLRLTVFPVLDPKMTPEGWWESVTGGAPEMRNTQPRQNIVQEAGPFLGGAFALNVTPLRIDWLLNPNVEEAPSEKLVTLGELPKTCDEFAKVMSKWFAVGPKAKRIAFGAVALQEVQSHEEGYRLIDRYLPALDLDPASSDFTYQINRPRVSGVIKDLKINRLSKWSVSKFQGMQLQIQPSREVGGSTVTGVATRELLASRVDLDINTDVLWSEPLDKPSAIFEELVGMALEITSRGDVA